MSASFLAAATIRSTETLVKHGQAWAVDATKTSAMPRRKRRTTKENMLDPQNLLLGVDENGTRIKVFTATLTGEMSLRAGVSHFLYTGDTIGDEDADDARPQKVERAEGGRRVTSAAGAITLTSQGALSSGRVRHGFGEIVYDSGSRYVGEWKRDKREGTGKYIFACGVSRASIHATMPSRLRKVSPCTHCIRALRRSSTLAGYVRRSVEGRPILWQGQVHKREQ